MFAQNQNVDTDFNRGVYFKAITKTTTKEQTDTYTYTK